MSVYAKQRLTDTENKLVVNNEKKKGESDKLGVPDTQTTFKIEKQEGCCITWRIIPIIV